MSNSHHLSNPQHFENDRIVLDLCTFTFFVYFLMLEDFFFLPHPQQVQVPRPEIQPAPQQQRATAVIALILNPLSHQGMPMVLLL